MSGEPPLASATADTPSPATPAPFASARRPTKRWFLGRTRGSCDVYWVDGDSVSPPDRTPCPGDLLDGERIRIAGKTCVREGAGDPDRLRPVVCPDPLTNAEKQDRASP